MVVHLSRHQACPLESLLFCQERQQSKDDGDVLVELQLHECMRHGVRDVLEMHGRALDEHSNGYNGIERSGRRASRLLRGCFGEFEVGSARGEEIGGRGQNV